MWDGGFCQAHREWMRCDMKAASADQARTLLLRMKRAKTIGHEGPQILRARLAENGWRKKFAEEALLRFQVLGWSGNAQEN